MPVAAQLTYKLKVEVDGSPLATDVEAALISGVVDDNLHLPDVFQLAFRDPGATSSTGPACASASEVRVKLFSADDPTGEPLIIGEVTAVEAVLDRQGTTDGHPRLRPVAPPAAGPRHRGLHRRHLRRRGPAGRRTVSA